VLFLKRIGVLCSGGDAQGMNAAIRSIVRLGLNKHKLEVFGIKDGYQGLIDCVEKIEQGEDIAKIKSMRSKVGNKGLINPDVRIFRMDRWVVSGIIDHGGTILGSARAPKFQEKEMRKRVADLLNKLDIHGLIVIGGDGSLRGAKEFHRETCFPVVGIPASIDNDIPGTDMSIGFDTAQNIAADAIQKINETAEAHHRIFIVEVMGRDSGQIALSSALAAGAEIVILPERNIGQRDRVNRIAKLLMKGFEKGRQHAVVVVAEGVRLQLEKPPSSISEFLRHRFDEIFNDASCPYRPMSVRVVVLSHLQRGGCPTVADRILAARFGEAAVEALVNWDKKSKMVALVGDKIKLQDISVADNDDLRQAAREKLLELYALCKTLARVEPLETRKPILDPLDVSPA